MITIDHVIETILTAIFSNDLLSGNLFLKGGQSLRIKEKLKNRFSADTDFSTPLKIENNDIFFEELESSLAKSFWGIDLYLFDYKPLRRPKNKKDGTPDFWNGWSIEFKIIESKKRNLPPEILSREAIIPDGSISPKITIDISEYEYCGSVEKIKLNNGVEVKSYSRALLILEKIRAICQQHKLYQYKNSDQRARDFYDIEKLWIKSLQENNHAVFIKELKKHLPFVFKAKEVDTVLLQKIFDEDFIEIQRTGWPQVESTVKGKLQDFDYYVQTLKQIVKLTIQD